jgi:condensin complex subunit 2
LQDRVSFLSEFPYLNYLSCFFTSAAKALTKKTGRPQDDEEDSDHDHDQDNENGNDKENLNSTNQPKDQQAKVKKPKKRRNISTVTKNPDTLNGRLDTIPLTDPFFAKLNSVIGDTNSSKRLMQNIIPTEESKLKLRQNMPVWSSKDQKTLNLNEKIDYKSRDPLSRLLLDRINLRLGNVSKLFVRQGLSNYLLTKEPMETYEDNDTSFRNRFNDDFNDTVLNVSNHVELQFDINAAVEPVPLERSVVMDFGDMDHEDFEDLNEMDQIAVQRCKGLKRQPVMIDDMQPETAVNLEYSYRPLDMIDQFWAGPSHWKFRQSRRTQMSIGMRASHFTNNSTENLGTDGQKPKVVRKRKIVKKMEATVEDSCNVEEESTVILLKIKSKMKGTQLSNQTIAKKWDAKKHKLPSDFKVPLDIFDKYNYASTMNINSNPDVTFTAGNDDDDLAPYDYNNENDRDYCSRVADIQSDTETETNTDMGQMDNNMEFDNVEMPPPPAPMDEIPDVFVGAPERIEKISIAFARRAKVVDMKQLKFCSWNLILEKHVNDPLHNPKFSDTLKELPKVLNRTMAENMSMPLAFYAVLHLCNDKGLLLNQNDEKLKDFDIEFVQTSI